MIKDFKTTESQIGQKAENLKKISALLKDFGVLVPDGIAVGTEYFDKIKGLYSDKNISSYRDIQIPPDMWKEVLNAIHLYLEDSKLVVRSSATCEDSIFFSGAGQYESFLNISTPAEIKIAIQKVYASLFSINSYYYSKIHNINLANESMGILIQKVAPVEKSGVLFSCDPLTGEKHIILESTQGLGVNVVSGNGDICRLELVSENDESILSSDFKRLIKVAKTIRDFMGYEVDIEWGICGEDLYIFQVRPIILNKRDETLNYQHINTSSYPVLSKGLTIGKIVPFSSYKSGCILYQDDSIDMNDLKKIVHAKGIILNSNGRLSHFANICRELGKPCLVIPEMHSFADDIYLLDSINGYLIKYNDLNSYDRVILLKYYFTRKIQNFNEGLEQFNGLIAGYSENKYEQVHFDIYEKEVIKKLLENGFLENNFLQKIITYDFNDNALIQNNHIFRIQYTNCTVRIQLKSLDVSDPKYRREENYFIETDNVKNAQNFMLNLGLQETGYQERQIVQYVNDKDDIVVNIITWPNAPAYIGIESSRKENIERLVKKIGLDASKACSVDGKHIFEKLNLKLKQCKFKG